MQHRPSHHGRRGDQSSDWRFYLPLAQQVSLLKDDLQEPVDQLLNDPELGGLVRTCLAGRPPASARTGRTGLAPDRVLRGCVLTHLKGWSLREVERELRSNLIYRRFTRYDAGVRPGFSTFSRVFAVASPAVPVQSHHPVVGVAREQGWRAGARRASRRPSSRPPFTTPPIARCWATASGSSVAASPLQHDGSRSEARRAGALPAVGQTRRSLRAARHWLVFP